MRYSIEASRKISETLKKRNEIKRKELICILTPLDNEIKKQVKRLRHNRYNKYWGRENRNSTYKTYFNWKNKNRESLRTTQRNYYIKNKEKIKRYKSNIITEYNQQRYLKNKLKCDVRTITNQKIKIPIGQICQHCNINLAIHKHHPDYSKPFNVEFLCRLCHDKIHRRDFYAYLNSINIQS